jgi:cell division protein FtsZ
VVHAVGMPSVAREDVATLVPSSKSGVRMSGEHRTPVPARAPTSPREATLALDEDQYDIPTFIRRQGGNHELP